MITYYQGVFNRKSMACIHTLLLSLSTAAGTGEGDPHSGDTVAEERGTTPSDAGSARDSLDPVDVQFIIAQALHVHAELVQDDKEVDDMLSAEPQTPASFEMSGTQMLGVEPLTSTLTTTSDILRTGLAGSSIRAVSEVEAVSDTGIHDAHVPDTRSAERPLHEEQPTLSSHVIPGSAESVVSHDEHVTDIDVIPEVIKPGKRSKAGGRRGRKVSSEVSRVKKVPKAAGIARSEIEQRSGGDAAAMQTDERNKESHSVGVSRSGRARKPTAKAVDNPE